MTAFALAGATLTDTGGQQLTTEDLEREPTTPPSRR